jgi:lysophospholipase L1-like esterase
MWRRYTRSWRAVVVVLGLTAVAAGPARAQDVTPEAPSPEAPAFTITPAVAERGYVRVRVVAEPGSTVRLLERVRGRRVPLATLRMQFATSGRRRLTTWRCDRLDRELIGVQTAPDGTVREVTSTVTTPTCKHRLTAVLINRPRAGGLARVAVGDRFGVGDVEARVCLHVGPERACRTVRLRSGVRSGVVTPKALRPGRGRLLLTTRGQRLVVAVDVRRRAGSLKVLAAGDSEIQVLDGFLRQRLKRFGASVISDDHISTSISNPGFFDWPQRARATASTIRPDVTVMFLGANDGFPFRSESGAQVSCCSPPWSRELARRTRGMMRSYSRGGRGRVYWMLLPPPRKANFARVFDAVNRGFEEAAKAFPDTVRLVDLRRTFPDPDAGRQPDGVHLSTASARIAAGVIERAMRRDGVL